MANVSRLLLLFSLLSLLSVSQLWARLNGAVEWEYANYEESYDSGASRNGAHFTERYSLLYSMHGLLSGGRLGGYDLAAGAEWAAFDSEFTDEDFSDKAFKFLYEGRLQIAPGGLPFRLDAYSYDMAKVSFDASAHNGFIYPGIVTDLHNGQTIISGVQLIGGIRNGSYLGKYRDVLAQWPRILVDYRDIYRRDLKARVPVEVRDSNLAFVSLNKKDNWFHYRVHTHTDYQNPEEDTRDSTIMLGTIDHRLQRQWINLTNWIRLSVDGSYSVSEEKWRNLEGNRFDLNLFTSMQRKGFTANTLASLSRVRQGDNSLEQTLSLPVYASNQLDPDTTLRSTLELWRNKETRLSWTEDQSEEAYYGKALLEANQRGRVLLSPSLEMELATGYDGDGQALRGKIEARSNPKRRENPALFGMAALASFSGSDENDEDTSLWEGELRGGGDYRLGRNKRLGGTQHLLYGTGVYASRLTHFMRSSAAGGFGDRAGSEAQFVDGSFFRSKTNLYFEHSSAARVQNRFELEYEFQRGDVDRLYSLELTHRLDYQSRWWRVTLKNSYATGDETSRDAPNSGTLAQSFNSSTEWRFEHRGIVDFRPTNYWKVRFEESLVWGEDAVGNQHKLFTARQDLTRTFYTFGGQRRKRGEITQSLHFEQYMNDVSRSSMIFSLTGNYYPTRFWRLGSSAHYYYRDYAGNSIYYTLTTGLDFPKFKVDFSYRYGAGEDDNVVAHRYEVNVKKTF